LDAAIAACPVPLPEPGERGAAAVWGRFLDDGLADYAARRDLAALEGTSRLSPYLTFGAIHPRTLLADLDERPGESAERFVAELAWREFYADVLWRHPRSGAADLRDGLAGLAYDEPGESFEAWCAGRTGYPLVDAGMRQLLAEGWMHNRVRMVVASFLTKDLHIWWPHGARYFMEHLLDGDLASNSHGWQWVAGTGTDASPYFRVFNPVGQSQRFDPAGAYVRRYVPELAHLPAAAALTPWDHPDGYAHGYVPRIVDHAAERAEALARYERARSARR
jgi:deoxyribodipyrimidine photo-lyase